VFVAAADNESAQPPGDSSTQNQLPAETTDKPHVSENNVGSSSLQPEQITHQQTSAESQAPPVVCILYFTAKGNIGNLF